MIYVDAEMVPQILNERAQNYGMDRSKLFVMLPEPGEMIDLGQLRYQDRLAEMTAVLNPELIIIDSLSSIHSSGQNNVEDVRSLIGYLTAPGRLGALWHAAGSPYPQALQRRAAHDELRSGYGGFERQRVHHSAGAGCDRAACGANRAGI